MQIRSISEKELALFSRFSQQQQWNDQLEMYLGTLWNERTSRPEWCFLATEAEQIVGRLVYWSPSPQVSPTDIDFFDIDWTHEAYVYIGTTLLQQSLMYLKTLGVQQIKYQLNDPNHLQPVTQQRLHVLETFGFGLRRKGYRWETSNMETRSTVHHELSYHVVSQDEEDSFLEIMKRTLAHSLDRGIQQDLTQLGLDGAAKKRQEGSKNLRRFPDGWQVVSLSDGVPVGVVMVAHNDGGPIIDYLGVLPEQRGHGYIHDLLAHGTNILLQHGAKCIRSDCDVNNEPMIHAFQRASFTAFCVRNVYWVNVL